MKKLLTALMIVTLILAPIFASEWDEGYLEGYRDALKGLPNKVQERQEAEKEPDFHGVWEIKAYVDDFGDPTDELYITNYSMGTFSNSATSNSRLSWRFLIDDSIALKLYEYGHGPSVGGSYDSDAYEMLVKEEDGTVHDYLLDQGSDRLYMQAHDTEQFLELLAMEKPLKIRINDRSRYSRSTYNLGSFDPAGFRNVYEKMKRDSNL